MQAKTIRTILGVATISALAIGCGKGFEPTKVDSALGATGGPSQAKPEQVERSPEVNIMKETLRAAQLIQVNESTLELTALVKLDKENIFEISTALKDLKDGQDNQQVIKADDVKVESVIMSDVPVDIFPVAEIAAVCFEECNIVRVMINLNTEASVSLLGQPMLVAMHFKRTEVGYVMDQSDTGHKRGFSAQDYAAEKVKVESEILQQIISASEADGDTEETEAEETDGDSVETDSEVVESTGEAVEVDGDVIEAEETIETAESAPKSAELEALKKLGTDLWNGLTDAVSRTNTNTRGQIKKAKEKKAAEESEAISEVEVSKGIRTRGELKQAAKKVEESSETEEPKKAMTRGERKQAEKKAEKKAETLDIFNNGNIW